MPDSLINTDKLEDMFRDINREIRMLRKEVEDVKQNNKQPVYIKACELAKFLSTDPATIYNWKKSGKLNYTRIGETDFFDINDLNKKENIDFINKFRSRVGRPPSKPIERFEELIGETGTIKAKTIVAEVKFVNPKFDYTKN
jgi:hypothetical protein